MSELEITDETKIKKLVDEKQKLICDYSKTLINNGNANKEKVAINDFNGNLLSAIAVIRGDIRTQQIIAYNLSKEIYNSNKKSDKLLTGTQLKKDIYEENTKLTMHLIYYVLGMGFMGYYIIKLLKK